jgi:hypothetical protein
MTRQELSALLKASGANYRVVWTATLCTIIAITAWDVGLIAGVIPSTSFKLSGYVFKVPLACLLRSSHFDRVAKEE